MTTRNYGVILSIFGVAGLIFITFFATQTAAMRFESGSFLIDAATVNNVGGASGSANYQLESSGGEVAIGNGSGGSYKMAAGYIPQIITPYISLSTQPLGLIGFFLLDENNGTAIHDESKNSNFAEIVGSSTWSAGKLGRALSFNGSNYVDLSKVPKSGLTEFSVSLWIRTNSSASSGNYSQRPHILGNNSSGSSSGDYGLTINNGYLGHWSGLRSGGDNNAQSSVKVNDNSWHYVAAVNDGSKIKLYVDGVDADADLDSGSATDSAGWFLGMQNFVGSAPSFGYEGMIDHVKIFNRPLSDAEIMAEYNAQDSGSSSGLTLRTIVPGSSNTSDFEIAVFSSGSSYSLAISQDDNLKSGSHTIPAISSSITSPVSWNESTTKGLGFSLVSSNATVIPAKWSAGSAYAAIPDIPTSMYLRAGLQSSSKDIIQARLRADVPSDQASGNYQNTMTITGTASP